jgi:hypothetical protein
MTDKNEITAIPAEAKEWAESVGDMVNSGVKELQSDYTTGGERKENGIDKDIVFSSMIDAVKDPIGLVKDSKRLELLDTIAEVQRKYLQMEKVRPVHLLKIFATLLLFLFWGNSDDLTLLFFFLP